MKHNFTTNANFTVINHNTGMRKTLTFLASMQIIIIKKKAKKKKKILTELKIDRILVYRITFRDADRLACGSKQRLG